MHYWHLLFNWSVLESVRKVHSFFEGLAIALFALLVLFDILAHRSEDTDKDRARRLEKIGLWFFGLAILAEIVTHEYSNRNDALSENEIRGLSAVSQQARIDANAAVSNAQTALRESDVAKSEAAKAKNVASEAELVARGARQEADSFEKRIVSATDTAIRAESHLAEALRRAAEATAALERIRSPRSIINASELVLTLKEFKGTEYTFSSVFGDEESILLLRSIDSTLQLAGWSRTSPPHGFPAVNIYGTEQEFSVPDGLTTGIQISVDTLETPAALMKRSPNALPQLVKVAIGLNIGLSSHVSPPLATGEWKLVDIQVGISKTVRIAVGKKP